MWADGPRCLLVGFSLAIGLLIGAEVPLLMALIQRIRRQDAGGAVADLFAADYVGALVGGLAFPFLLLPLLGQLTGALLTGAVNVVGGRRAGAVAVPPRPDRAGRAGCCSPSGRGARRCWPRPPSSSATSSGPPGARCTGRRAGRRADRTYRRSSSPGPGRHAARPLPGRPAAGRRPGRAPLPRGAGPPRDVRPAPAGADPRRRRRAGRARGAALPGCRVVDVVELDAGLVRLARRTPASPRSTGTRTTTRGCTSSPADAFDGCGAARGRVRRGHRGPARPGDHGEHEALLRGVLRPGRRVLAPGGRLAVHAGPVAARPRASGRWTATLRAAGLATALPRPGPRLGLRHRPGPLGGPSGGPADWGFVLAAPARSGPRSRLDPHGAPGPATLRRAGTCGRTCAAAERTRQPGLPPSTLAIPRY